MMRTVLLAALLMAGDASIAGEPSFAQVRQIVTDRCGSIGDIVLDGENAFIYPAGDTAALAASMTRLIAKPALRARLLLAVDVIGGVGIGITRSVAGLIVQPAIAGHWAQLLLLLGVVATGAIHRRRRTRDVAVAPVDAE